MVRDSDGDGNGGDDDGGGDDGYDMVVMVTMAMLTRVGVGTLRWRWCER